MQAQIQLSVGDMEVDTASPADVRNYGTTDKCIKQQAELLQQYGPYKRQDTELNRKLWNMGHMDLLIEHCLILESEGKLS